MSSNILIERVVVDRLLVEHDPFCSSSLYPFCSFTLFLCFLLDREHNFRPLIPPIFRNQALLPKSATLADTDTLRGSFVRSFIRPLIPPRFYTNLAFSLKSAILADAVALFIISVNSAVLFEISLAPPTIDDPR